MPKQLVSSSEKSASWHRRPKHSTSHFTRLVTFQQVSMQPGMEEVTDHSLSLSTFSSFLPSHTPHNLCWCFSTRVTIWTFYNTHVWENSLNRLEKFPELSTRNILQAKRRLEPSCSKALAPFRFWTRGLSVWMDRKSECVRGAKNNDSNKTAILTPLRPPLREACSPTGSTC